jgi:hypothetical protein
MNSPFGTWYRLTPRGQAGLACDCAGVALGPVPLIAARQGRYRLRPAEELIEAFALAYGPPSPETFARWHAGLSRVAKALDEGKDALAAISAVQLGFPTIAPERMAKLAGSHLAKAYDPDEPRVPAGNPDGGQWTGDGPAGVQIAENGNVQSDAPKYDKATLARARVIYGETAGLRPALLNPNGNSNDPANWDAASAAELAKARLYIGIVSERNSKVWSDEPGDPNNPIQAQAWDLALDAAGKGVDSSQLDSRIKNFTMRQGYQPSPWPEKKQYMSFGPFYSVGGGAIGRGSQSYIDFYGSK